MLIYKLELIETFNTIIDEATNIDEVIDTFGQCLIRSVAENSRTHRLWYDIKSQALFDPEFIETVAEVDALLIDMVNNLVVKTVELGGKSVELSAQHLYWMLDGFSQHFLRLQLANDTTALTGHERELRTFPQRLLR